METKLYRNIKLSAIINRFFSINQIASIPNIFFIILLSIIGISLLLLYSAGHGLYPWCVRQLAHFAFGFGVMLVVGSTRIRIWYSFAYVLYVAAFVCLLFTAFFGKIGMGAQRWIQIASIQFQPSEIMRIALVAALARRFNDVPLTKTSPLKLILFPSLLVILPVLVTLEQPDLGTAMLLVICSVAMFFFAGMRVRFFVMIFIGFIACLPIFWHFLHDYQKNRIFTFLHPEKDPLGCGYHVIQSKIAIGSGGFLGKGFMQGSQGALDFLPEKHTDFIFTLLSEEFGFIGALILLTLYCLFILFGLSLALSLKDNFRRLVILGMTVSFSLYAIINIAMVVGLLPVVGIPLPFVSYGGTSLVTLLAGQGLVIASAYYKQTERRIKLYGARLNNSKCNF
ncbi:MAG: rod shape-determining protein RodA [Holosporales bacterium]|jgi:rod shape determining protein RodA|nr:rod shape-determining protein RodA [Holosporales bacterium]